MAPNPPNPSPPARPCRLIRKPANPHPVSRSWTTSPLQILRPSRRSLLRAVFLCSSSFYSWACSSSRRRELLHEPVIEVHAVVKVLDADALVSPMLAIVVDVKKHAGDAIGRDAGDARGLPVRGPGRHRRDERDTWPGDAQDFLRGLSYFRK